MKSIGGYIELESFDRPMLHEDATKLNTARNCLAYLICAKKIKRIWIPKFLCDSVARICREYDLMVNYYGIDKFFEPQNINISKGDWLYLVNYYGLISNSRIIDLKNKYGNIIVDNVQAYYQEPIKDIDTIYTCRKFFGVSDGAFLYSNVTLDIDFEQDYSYDRMHHLLGRFEKGAEEFYGEYVKDEEAFIGQPIKYMSKLTLNFLHALDYEDIKIKRRDNYSFLCDKLDTINKLDLKNFPEVPFMYPLYIDNANEIRKSLQNKKIFVPTLWPDVFDICDESEYEYDLAKNILPLPVDQRYNKRDMEYVVNEIMSEIEKRM